MKKIKKEEGEKKRKKKKWNKKKKRKGVEGLGCAQGKRLAKLKNGSETNC